MNYNKGYIGNKYSVRANEAYNEGKIPISKIKKNDLKDLNLKYEITLDFFKYLVKKIGTSEWHHTSKFFNETYFYNLDEIAEKINNLEDIKLNNMKKEYLEEVNEMKNKVKSLNIKWVVANWITFEGNRNVKRNHYEEYGVLLDNWIYIYNYGKKNKLGKHITYSEVNEEDVHLPSYIKELLLDELKISPLTKTKKNNRLKKAQNYKIISLEKKKEISKEILKNKKKKEQEEKDMADLSLIKRKNLLKKIIKLESETGYEMIEDKTINIIKNVYEGKELINKLNKIVSEIYFRNLSQVVKRRQLMSKELGFPYYLEEFILDNHDRLDARKIKRLFEKRKNEYDLSKEADAQY